LERVVSRIAEKLRLRLTDLQRKQITRRGTENTEAYDLFLKGRHYWNQGTQDAMKKADEFFEAAASKVDHLDGKMYFERDMKYFIPLSVYRPLKDQGIDVLMKRVVADYCPFDPGQYFSLAEMERRELIHPRQCMLVSQSHP